MTSTTGNTNISNTAQIQTPNDYIEKGINELTMDYYSVVNPGKKRSVGNLVVGVGLLITANMVKTIMISLITENQKNIHKAILDGFGLLSFENLYCYYRDIEVIAYVPKNLFQTFPRSSIRRANLWLRSYMEITGNEQESEDEDSN